MCNRPWGSVLTRKYKGKSSLKCQERRPSKHLKNIVQLFIDLDRIDRVMPVLVILLFPVLRIQNFNLFVDFIDTIHSLMRIVEHRYEYLLEQLLSCKK
jgi:hypothetical protein